MPMHAAYCGGPATSAASSFRDSGPATLSQHLRSNCLHAPPPLGSLLASPITRYSRACNRPSPQHATSSPHCRRSQAPAHSAAAADEHKRTVEVQRRQLRHPSEARCQRRCPIISDSIVCTHRRPRLAPRKPHHPLQPGAYPSRRATRSIIIAFASVRKHPLPAQLPPMHAAYH